MIETAGKDKDEISANANTDKEATMTCADSVSGGKPESRDGASASPQPQSPTTSNVSMDSWEDFVLKFQDQMQVYRNLVRDYNEDDCDIEKLDEIEAVVVSLGLHLVKTWKGPIFDELVKIRAKQLLNYVAAYCESHKRPQVRERFLAFLAECVEGTIDRDNTVFYNYKLRRRGSRANCSSNALQDTTQTTIT